MHIHTMHSPPAPLSVSLSEKETDVVSCLLSSFEKSLAAKARENGVLRLFLSSPFTGMEEERRLVCMDSACVDGAVIASLALMSLPIFCLPPAAR